MYIKISEEYFLPDVTPWLLVGIDKLLGGTSSLHIPCKIFVNSTRLPTRLHIPEDIIFYGHFSQNFKYPHNKFLASWNR